MATQEKIRRTIQEIAARKRNTTLEQIEWVMNQLKAFSKITERNNDHQRIYSIDGRRFGVCTHHPGGRHLDPAYVREFLSAMTDTGWYED